MKMDDLEAVYFGESYRLNVTNRHQLAAVILRLPYRDMVDIGNDMANMDSAMKDDPSADLALASILSGWAAVQFDDDDESEAVA